MNEKLLEIAESVARIETTLGFVLGRLEELEKRSNEDHTLLTNARSVFRATAIIAAALGSASAVAMELLLR